MRWFLPVLVLAAALMTFNAGAGSPGTDTSVQVADAVMQCMEQCIRNEGKDEKDTCKMRCANVGTHGGGKRDCGQDYRACKKACPKKDKACAKVCKNTLMNCV